jgi:hypothetical protein
MDEMLKKLITALKKLKITYVIIGGIAASILGKPRTTIDADVVFIIKEEKIEEFIKILKLYGFKISEHSKEKIILRLKRLLPVKIRFKHNFSVDLRLASYSIDMDAIKRAIAVKIFGMNLSIATPEDIIVYKIARFEDIDKADIKGIISRFGEKLDLDYIRNSAKKLAQETGNNYIIDNLRTVLTFFK